VAKNDAVARSRTPAPARVATAPLARASRPDVVRLLPSGRSLLLGFGLVAFAAGAYGVARMTPLFAVRAVDVRGAPPEVRAKVLSVLEREIDTSLLALRGDSILQRVAALPDVVSATYDRDFPHTLRVLVRPERPVAVLRRGRESWLVSARGRVIERLPPRSRPGLPRVWLRRTVRVEVGEFLGDRGGNLAVRAVARLGSARLARRVRGAVLSSRFGLVLVLRSGVEIRFGAASDLALKLAVVERIVPLLPSETTVLDVSVPARPVSTTNPQLGG
jgi:cell division protein FtsQ